jgi:hypothetical protein
MYIWIQAISRFAVDSRYARADFPEGVSLGNIFEELQPYMVLEIHALRCAPSPKIAFE